MDFEKEYKGLVAKIKKAHQFAQTDSTKSVLEDILPQLRESEDERMMRVICLALTDVPEGRFTSLGTTLKDCLAYLEKQKENPKSADSIPSNCVSDAKCEDRWHKVGDSLPDNGREVLAKDKLGNTLLARYDGEGWDVSVYDDEDYRCHNGISKWCEIPSEKQKEQKPITESKRLANEVIEYLTGCGYSPILKDDSKKEHFHIDIPRHKDDFWLSEEYKHCRSVLGEYYMEGDYGGDTYTLYVWREKKEQKPADKQDYSGLTDLERAIHRGFLCAGVENVPVTIIKETAQECLAQMKPAKWSEKHIADIFEKVGLAKIVREQGNDALTNACQSAMLELSKVENTEWSEEDERLLGDVLGCITLVQTYKACGDLKDFKTEYTGEELRSFVRSLKSRPRKQPHWKPSEQEKGALRTAIYVLTEERNFPKAAAHLQVILDAFDGKESRKDWKPSKQQMMALADALEDMPEYYKPKCTLESLERDLKKL